MSFFGSMRAGVRGSLVAAALALSVTACATAPTDPVEREIYEEANDPLQPFNEAMFDFNLALYKGVLKPVAQAYEYVVPELARDSVRNFLRNLRSPVIFVNHALQGEPERAGDELGRFMFNSFGGLFGLFDVATAADIPDEEEDFGQTLAVWGVEEGPYLVLPIYGSTNVRDISGEIVDLAFDPLFWIGLDSDEPVVEYNGIIRYAVNGIDETSRNYRQIDALEETSLDFYSTVRSLYRQQRNSLIRNGAEDDEELPEIGFDDDFIDEVGDDPQANASVSE